DEKTGADADDDRAEIERRSAIRRDPNESRIELAAAEALDHFARVPDAHRLIGNADFTGELVAEIGHNSFGVPGGRILDREIAQHQEPDAELAGRRKLTNQIGRRLSVHGRPYSEHQCAKERHKIKLWTSAVCHLGPPPDRTLGQ